MDPLAFLCSLFAEGPSTLRVLHRAGIRTLPNVLATDAWALAEILGTSPSAARRFAREAGRLAAGDPTSELDAEESSPVGRPTVQ